MGFVVGDRRIVTCAHVVNAALGREQRAQAAPEVDARVQVDFPLLSSAGGASLRSCRVDAWVPPPLRGGVLGGDVAGLVLVDEDVPDGAGPARLTDPAAHRDSVAVAFGYPGEPPRAGGGWATLRLRGVVAGGLLQLDVDSASAFRAQPGFAGAPLVLTDDAGDTVVAMLAVTGRDSDTRDAYAIPVSRLADAWPLLGDQRIALLKKRLFGRYRTPATAVVSLATVLAACAVGFGVWATLTRNSALFGRQTALAGIYSLVLAAVATAVGMIAWALRR
jgi:hypothetical protein